MFSELSIIGGLWLSYELDIASGATIVLINILILLLVGIFRKFYVRKKLKETKLNLQGK